MPTIALIHGFEMEVELLDGKTSNKPPEEQASRFDAILVIPSKGDIPRLYADRHGYACGDLTYPALASPLTNMQRCLLMLYGR